MNPLLICYFPAGIAYVDRLHEESGDYRRVAFLSYRTLKFEPAKNADESLLGQARQHALAIQSMRGQELVVSTCGQTVILGET